MQGPERKKKEGKTSLSTSLKINHSTCMDFKGKTDSWWTHNFNLLEMSDAGKDQRPEDNGTTEDEMVGWHHWLSGREFEQLLGDGEEQGSLVCSGPLDCKELDRRSYWTTEKSDQWVELWLSIRAGELGIKVSFLNFSRTEWNVEENK